MLKFMLKLYQWLVNHYQMLSSVFTVA